MEQPLLQVAGQLPQAQALMLPLELLQVEQAVTYSLIPCGEQVLILLVALQIIT